MKGKTLLVFAGIVGLVWVSRKIRAAKSVEFSPGLPTNFSVKDGVINFLLPITSFNASGTPINIGGIDLRVYANSKSLGRAYITTKTRVAGTGATVFPVNVRISISDLVAAIPGFTTGKNITLKYTGVATIENVWFPVDFVQTFAIPVL